MGFCIEELHSIREKVEEDMEYEFFEFCLAKINYQVHHHSLYYARLTID